MAFPHFILFHFNALEPNQFFFVTLNSWRKVQEKDRQTTDSDQFNKLLSFHAYPPNFS
jgi:hypothetical protein